MQSKCPRPFCKLQQYAAFRCVIHYTAVICSFINISSGKSFRNLENLLPGNSFGNKASIQIWFKNNKHKSIWGQMIKWQSEKSNWQALSKSYISPSQKFKVKVQSQIQSLKGNRKLTRTVADTIILQATGFFKNYIYFLKILNFKNNIEDLRYICRRLQQNIRS